MDGSDAEATRVVESFFCTGTLEGTALAFDYNAVLMSSGDIFATGTVIGVNVSSSESAIWHPSQNGYETAAVPPITYDVIATTNGGFFVIDLNRATLETHIVYRDTEATGGRVEWIMQPDACVHNMYD